MIWPSIHSATRNINGRYKRADKPDKCIIRFATGALHMRMLAASARWHSKYAAKYNYDLIHIEVNLKITASYGWLRWQYIREALDHYHFVALLETDAIIATDLVDIELACDKTPLSMRYGQYGNEPAHFQTGVIFAKRSDRVIQFLDELNSACPPTNIPEEPDIAWWDRQACQQKIANDMLHSNYKDIVSKLNWQWNCVNQDLLFKNDEGLAIIRAWHGLGNEPDKLKATEEFIAIQEAKPYLRKLAAIKSVFPDRTDSEILDSALDLMILDLRSNPGLRIEGSTVHALIHGIEDSPEKLGVPTPPAKEAGGQKGGITPPGAEAEPHSPSGAEALARQK